MRTHVSNGRDDNNTQPAMMSIDEIFNFTAEACFDFLYTLEVRIASAFTVLGHCPQVSAVVGLTHIWI